MSENIRTVTITLEEYDQLRDNSDNIKTISESVVSGTKYSFTFYRDYSHRETYLPQLLRDTRKVFTNDDATKVIIEDLLDSQDQFKKIDFAFSELCAELNGIKSKWWYKLFN